MKYFSNHDDGEKQAMEELLIQFENLRKGNRASYIEEESFEKLIEYFESQEEFRKAMQAVEIAMNQFPYSGALLVKKADLLLNEKKYTQALELLEQASIFDNNNIDIYILKTEVFLALDRQKEAVALLEQALHSFEGDDRIDLLFELADVYDDYENFEKIFDCLKAILEQDPNNEEALYKICFWTDFTGRNAESIDLHQKIINEFPYNELAWFNLGAAYQGIKLYEKAIDAYKYAIVIDDKFDYAHRNMGDAFIRLRKYKDAVECLERVLELSKPEDIIYEAIGFCFEKLKNYAQARFYYRKASHLNPENSTMFYKVAFTYYKENKYEQSIKQLEAALKIKNNKPEYNLLMGECKMEAGFYKDAIPFFLNAIHYKPKSINGWEALVKCLYKAEYYEDALEQLDQAIFITSKKPVFVYYKAAVFFAMGKAKEALSHLEDAIIMSPSYLKKIIQLNPSLLQLQSVSDLIIKYKKKKRKKL
jgi:tetratricopeptide (TPR) repeat protein